MVQKIYSKTHPVSCAYIHHDVTDLVNQGMVKNTKTWISWKWNITFLRNKKILNLCHRWHILRSFRFVGEATFKHVHFRNFGCQFRVAVKNGRYCWIFLIVICSFIILKIWKLQIMLKTKLHLVPKRTTKLLLVN